WSGEPRRTALSDLRPILSAETWEALLRQVRAHLEAQSPLDIEFPVQLPTGHSEWWHLRGCAQRSNAGHPTHVAGSVREVTAPRPP
ncbi:MAG TPA: hypothetical protein VHS76_13005, partial [Steroidobacteraceae bacterium]|nr:hypothetical protein [Steroidobacteraceae bacterium]